MLQSLNNRIVGQAEPESTSREAPTESGEATAGIEGIESTNEDLPSSPDSIPSPSVSKKTHKNSSSSSNILDDDDDGNLCPICKDVLAAPFVTRCGHSFCYVCITRHLDKQFNCPICRQSLNKNQISPNFQLTTIIERQLSKPKPPHTTITLSDSNLRLLTDYIDRLPHTEDVQSILSNAIVKRRKLKVREKDIQSRLLSYFLATAQTYAGTEARKWKQKQNMAQQDLISLGHHSSLQVQPPTQDKHLTYIDDDKLSIEEKDPERDDNDDNSDNFSENFEQNTRKRKHDDEEDITPPSNATQVPNAFSLVTTNSLIREIYRMDRIITSRKARIFRHFSDLLDLYFTGRKEDGLDKFSNTLYQMTRYNNWIPLDSIHYADLASSSAIVSSMEFDRDEDYLAVGGVMKEIKIYDYNMVNDKVEHQTALSTDKEQVDRSTTGISTGERKSTASLVHCPLLTIRCDYKISCLSWNPYIKSRLASSDYEGVVNVWDATTGRNVQRYEEHQKRAWSVDTSTTNPTIMASGSDDSTVKIWSIHSRWSVLTLQQRGNICCAKFAPNNEHLIAVGSADHHITCYDLRNPKTHLQVFAGHDKAVSYVKWINDNEIISASTDNTLKSWKMGIDGCTRTYTGHQNEKNFVGLSLKDDWIACGSENNTLFTYHKNSSHPVAQYKLPVVDPITGHESFTEGSLFVSSVCWKRNSMKLLAANSKGFIKVLQLVE